MNKFYIVFLLLFLPASAQGYLAHMAYADTVYVATPTGEKKTDRASIQKALKKAHRGDTIQFAQGMYKIGPMIRVDVPEITLLGHFEGTVIRGCDPDEFPEHERALFECHGFELSAARQTVRNLTFEYGWHGLYVGCCFPETPEEMEVGKAPPRSQPGGHLIEENTFRYTPNGLRVIGEGAETTVVQNNRFIDVYHAIGINGGPVHFLNNEMSVKHPERVPTSTHPGDVINVTTYSILSRTPVEDHTSCRNNRIENNRIEGYPDGIRIVVYRPGTSCRNNVIRNNTISVDRVRFAEYWHGIRRGNEQDSTVIGIPLRLSNLAKARAPNDTTANAVLQDNLIEGNLVIGADGLGLEILHASGNRITNNTFSGIKKRDLFPGNTLGGEPESWHQANGSGIWLSPSSEGNEIIGNTFEDIASYAVFVEGDSNRIELSDPAESVMDLGKDNQVVRSDGSAKTESEKSDPSQYASKFVETRGVRFQYMDFGGEGIPLIWVQDFHNYFEGPYSKLPETPKTIDFFSSLSKEIRVLAPVRRGYGKSTDTKWGYDVATQAEDILGFMDALGIEKAVLFGRLPANQDMTWIAEHHPDRLAGLIYWGNPILVAGCHKPDVLALIENWSAISGEDFEKQKEKRIVMSRALWRPHFLNDPSMRIDIPALRFTSKFDLIYVFRRMVESGRIEKLIEKDGEGFEEEVAALRDIVSDSIRYATLKNDLIGCDRTVAIDQGMVRAFGKNLRTINEDNEQFNNDEYWKSYFHWLHNHISIFISELNN